jgi:uncharacterized protein (DUF1499 family)
LNRNTDFTAATVTWSQSASLPVTSTAVTYCPTSSPNCGNSVNCMYQSMYYQWTWPLCELQCYSYSI